MKYGFSLSTDEETDTAILRNLLKITELVSNKVRLQAKQHGITVHTFKQ